VPFRSPLKENLVAFNSGTHEENTRTGARTVAMDVSPEVSEDGRRFEMIFQIPEIIVSGQYSKRDIGTGGCPAEEYDKTFGGRTGEGTLSVEDIRFKGSVFPGIPEKISGTADINLLPLGIAVDGVTLTHTAHVTYNLYRFH